MQMNLTVEAKLTCGTWRMFPANAEARTLAQLVNAPTLSPHHLRYAQRLGYALSEINGRADVLAKLLEA